MNKYIDYLPIVIVGVFILLVVPTVFAEEFVYENTFTSKAFIIQPISFGLGYASCNTPDPMAPTGEPVIIPRLPIGDPSPIDVQAYGFTPIPKPDSLYSQERQRVCEDPETLTICHDDNPKEGCTDETIITYQRCRMVPVEEDDNTAIIEIKMGGKK